MKKLLIVLVIALTLVGCTGLRTKAVVIFTYETPDQ